MCFRCFSSATAKGSPLLQQWAAAPLKYRDCFPSTSRGNISLHFNISATALGLQNVISNCVYNVCVFSPAVLYSSALMVAAVRCRLLCANGRRSWTTQAWCAVCSRQQEYRWSSWSNQTPSWSRRLKHCQPKQRSALLTEIISKSTTHWCNS